MSDRDVADDDTLSAQTRPPLAVPGFGPPSADATPAVTTRPEVSGRTVRKAVLVLGGVIVFAIVMIVVLAWLAVSVIRGAVDDVESNRDETAITVEEYQSIRLGMAEADVRGKLGEPADKSTSGAAEGSDSAGGATTCLYYNEQDAGLIAGDRFKFCFTGGRLVRKSRN